MWLKSFAAQVVENPRKPKAPNAGRVIVPKEAMAIPVEVPNSHLFSYALNPCVAPDGSLLVRTIPNSDDRTHDRTQLLMFDKTGMFVRSLDVNGAKRMNYSGFFLAGKNIAVMAEGGGNSYVAKLLWFDAAGIYEREITLPYENCSGCWTPLAFFDGIFYFIYQRGGPDDQDGKPGIVDHPWSILSFTESSDEYTSLASFPTKDYYFGGECDDGRCHSQSTSISNFRAAPYQNKYLVLSNTREYLLKIYDPVTNAVIREFRRDYKRAKNKQRKVETIIDGKSRAAPHQKYTSDIVNIFAHGDEIWAVTSTRDKARGVLIDIFDSGGIFKDFFYLKLPEQSLNALQYPEHSTLDGNALYTISIPNNKGDACVIRKYFVEK